MKTLRIVILDDGGDVPQGLRSGQLPGIDLRQLEGLSGHDVAALLREHSMPAPFVDTNLDSLAGPPSDFAHSDLEHELRSRGHEGDRPALPDGAHRTRALGERGRCCANRQSQRNSPFGADGGP